MAFFKSEPNVSDGEKARIEFHLQQVAECVGFGRFQLPVLGMDLWRGMAGSGQGVQRIIDFVGRHLSYNTNGIAHEVVPQQIVKPDGG